MLQGCLIEEDHKKIKSHLDFIVEFIRLFYLIKRFIIMYFFVNFRHYPYFFSQITKIFYFKDFLDHILHFQCFKKYKFSSLQTINKLIKKS